MSDREKLWELVDAIPDYKLCYAITYLQGLTDGGRAELKERNIRSYGRSGENKQGSKC